MTLAVGQLLQNRYLIHGLLGQGGMGAVYDAVDTHLNIHCAIKENQLITEASTRQFEREARLLAALRHSHLPRVTDHFLVPSQGQYLVMDFVEGEDLHQRLERVGVPSEAEILRWAENVLEAILYLHQRGVVHRDIKPRNIKITPQGQAILVDFGIAKEISGSSDGITSTGARGLTPGFAPPEQYGFGSGHTDIRSDIYSLGATLYTLFVGTPPADALTRLAHPDQFIPLASRHPGLRRPLSRAIDKALALEPTERFQNTGEMLAALQIKSSASEGETVKVIEVSTEIARQPDIATPTAALTLPEAQTRARNRWTRNLIASLFLLAILMIMSGSTIRMMSNSPATVTPLPMIAVAPSATSTATKAPATATSVPTIASTATLTPTSSSTRTPTPSKTSTPLPTFTYTPVPPTITPTPLNPSALPAVLPPDWSVGICGSIAGSQEICLFNRQRNQSINLTNHPAMDNQPSLSPDRRRIVFVSNRDDVESEIYIINVDGAGFARLTNSRGFDISPSWSPDGTKIYFQSTRDGNKWGYYIMNIDGSGASKVP